MHFSRCFANPFSRNRLLVMEVMNLGISIFITTFFILVFIGYYGAEYQNVFFLIFKNKHKLLIVLKKPD